MDRLSQLLETFDDFGQTDPLVFAALSVATLLILLTALLGITLWPFAPEPDRSNRGRP